MNKNLVINYLMFIFALILFLYSFFTIDYEQVEMMHRRYTLSLAVIIIPLICISVLFKLLYFDEINNFDKKKALKDFKYKLLNKLYEGVVEYKEWKKRF